MKGGKPQGNPHDEASPVRAPPELPQLHQWQQGNAVKMALAQRGVSPAARLLLVHLCQYLNVNFECYPSQGRLAAEMGLDLRTVRRLVAELGQAGLIEVTRKWKMNRYKLVFLTRNHVEKTVDGI